MKDLALNMIMGPGDGCNLIRCLNAFNIDDLFDEIVITDTTQNRETSQLQFNNHKNVKVFYNDWSSDRFPFGNFANARNNSLKNTTSKYIMWLDCDDLPCNGFSHNIVSINSVFGKFDVFTFDYVVSSKEQINASVRRERIWRNTPSLFWKFAVHEQLTIDRGMHSIAHVGNLSILHSPTKSVSAGSSRNLMISQSEYYKNPIPETKYYYGRNLLECGDEKGLELLQNIIDSDCSNNDLIAQSCELLCNYFNRKKIYDKLETYSRIGMSFNPNYADFIIYIAESYERKLNYDGAIELYKKALACKFSGGGIYNTKYYTIIPAFKLMELYIKLCKYEEALLIGKIAKKYSVGTEYEDTFNSFKKHCMSKI
jgi:glycosyltransferase involved in cell wall biosynthesis